MVLADAVKIKKGDWYSKLDFKFHDGIHLEKLDNDGLPCVVNSSEFIYGTCRFGPCVELKAGPKLRAMDYYLTHKPILPMFR